MAFPVVFKSRDLGVEFGRAMLFGPSTSSHSAKGQEVAYVRCISNDAKTKGIKQLRIGDFVLAVNGMPMAGKDFSGVYNMLANSERPLSVVFQRLTKKKLDFRKAAKGVKGGSVREIGQKTRQLENVFAGREKKKEEKEALGPIKEGVLAKVRHVEKQMEELNVIRNRGSEAAAELRRIEQRLAEKSEAKRLLQDKLRKLRKDRDGREYGYDVAKYALAGIQTALAALRPAVPPPRTPSMSDEMMEVGSAGMSTPRHGSLGRDSAASSQGEGEVEEASTPVKAFTEQERQMLLCAVKLHSRLLSVRKKRKAKPEAVSAKKASVAAKKVRMQVQQLVKQLDGGTIQGDNPALQRGLKLALQLVEQHAQLHQLMVAAEA